MRTSHSRSFSCSLLLAGSIDIHVIQPREGVSISYKMEQICGTSVISSN